MTRQSRNIAITAGFLIALVAPFACADQLSPPRDNVPGPADLSGNANDAHPAFDALDANKDGRLGHDEAASNTLLAKQFDTYDRDNDGALTRAEYEDYVALEGSRDDSE